VIKMERVLQTLFYVLKYEREQICEPGTNKLDWKRAKTLIDDDLFYKMGDFDFTKQGTGDFKEYQKLTFLKKNLEGITEESIDEYCVVMCKIFKWVQLAIELRIDDVVSRRDAKAEQRREREAVIQREQKRTEQFEEELRESKAAFEEKQELEAAKEEDEEASEGEKKEKLEFNLDEFTFEFE